MPNEIDYENVLADILLQHREKYAPVSLFVDCERSEEEATKYLLRRLGVETDVESMSEEDKNEVRRVALSMKDIHITTVITAKTMQKFKEEHPRVAVYARINMGDPVTTEFLKAATLADHLVIISV